MLPSVWRMADIQEGHCGRWFLFLLGVNWQVLLILSLDAIFGIEPMTYRILRQCTMCDVTLGKMNLRMSKIFKESLRMSQATHGTHPEFWVLFTEPPLNHVNAVSLWYTKNIIIVCMESISRDFRPYGIMFGCIRVLCLNYNPWRIVSITCHKTSASHFWPISAM
jgi:hypothetical protein